MKIIEEYVPPTPAELADLKRRLGQTSNGMAKLCYLSQGGQWRRYTGVSSERPFGALMHFYLAALRTLPPEQIEQVFATMREDGAELYVGDFEPLPA